MTTSATSSKNDRREIFGWKMYDWANSAFSTTVAGALFGPYLTRLAQTAVGENGVVLNLGALGEITAKSLPTLCVSISVGMQVFMLPILGALGDYSNLKKRLMALFCFLGVAATCLLFFVQGNLYLAGGVLFIVANICFGASIVFYNAFLPEITTEDEADKVSSRGFAYGYLGGALLLVVNLLLVLNAERFGMTTGLAVRLSLLSAGIWWGGFALITFALLKSRPAKKKLPPGKSYLSAGFAELRATFIELRRLPLTARYLLGYLIYNDGIQTVIVAASTFLEQELFPQGNPVFLLEIFLMVQFVAVAGALFFERLAYLMTTKKAIIVSLIIWSGIVIYAYGFLNSVPEAWVLAGVIAIVLGGSQALSRSLFSKMIPEGKEASFFGLYEVSERGTSWMGPLLFSLVVSRTGSYRLALLSLIFFFVVGLIVLWLTDTDRAIRESQEVAEK
ncbi:MAG TPA: MFS transporter [Pyrinomonadaceae bacterium]|nr:MFS transporter [Pyrinomonadaceae bacterium]